ncbi:hypothetical protein ACRASX_16270 (plasmid) [Flavobacterium sp. TMP13]|uniref:hypothetical protein n=1 Tax=Flavobacterium sp. TMP13 TaxID=3425950 RepID=UPI003D789909
MKIKILLAMLVMAFTSCSTDADGVSSESSSKNTEIKTLAFSSEKEMDEEIDNITNMKSQSDKLVLADYHKLKNSNGLNTSSKKKNNLDVENQNELMYNSLQVYHKLLLSNIYDLRKQLNFTSIQSIADEINSLNAVDYIKAKSLADTYNDLLVKDPITGFISTIYDSRTSNVINAKGVVLIENEKLNYAEYSSIPNETGKYIASEASVTEVVAKNGDYTLLRSSTRQVHRNDLGFKFFRYTATLFTWLNNPDGNHWDPSKPVLIQCPSTFDVDPVSIAGFALSNTNTFFGDYSFTYQYLSGEGLSTHFVGGKKNNAYVPVGGRVKGTFTSILSGVDKQIICDVKYSDE